MIRRAARADVFVTVLPLLIVLACAPGLDDTWVARWLGASAQLLPAALRWGFEDAVIAPKLLALLWSCVVALCVVPEAHVPGGEKAPTERVALACFLGHLGMLLLSLAASNDPLAGVLPLAGLFLTALLALLSAARGGVAAIDALLAGCAWAGAANAIYSLVQHAGADPLAWTPVELVQERTIGTLGNPDYLGTYLACTTPLLSMLTLRSKTLAGRLSASLATALAVAATFFTYTRGGYLSLGCALAVVLLGQGRLTAETRRGLGRIAVLSAALLLLGYIVIPRHGEHDLMRRLHQTVHPRDRSTEARLVLWSEAARVCVSTPWLGSGPGTFNEAYRPHRWLEPAWLLDRVAVPNDPHCAWLQVASESGLLAGFTLVLLCFLTLRRLYLALQRWGDNSLLEHEALLLSAGLAAWMVGHCFVQAPLWDWLLLWLLCMRAHLGLSVPAPKLRLGWGRTALVCALVLTLGPWTSRVVQVQTSWCKARNLAASSLDAGGAQGASLAEQANLLYDLACSRAPSVWQGLVMQQHGLYLERLAARFQGTASQPEIKKIQQFLAQGSLQRYQQALTSRASDPYLHAQIARVSEMLLQGTSEQAAVFRQHMMAHSARGCTLDPYNTTLLADHAGRCVRARKLLEAEEYYRRAARCTESFAVLVGYGELLASLGKSEAARWAFEQAKGLAKDAAAAAWVRECRDRSLHDRIP